MRRRLLAAVLVLSSLAGPVLADATLDRLKQRGRLVVGVMLSGPPFGSIDPATQKHIGYNVELSEALARALGVGLETVQVQPSNRVQFLQTGKVDVLIANMQWTAERAEILGFAPTPFEEVGGTAIARRGSGLRDWGDLRGKPVCVSQGSNYIKPLEEQYGAQIKAFRGQPESLLALRGGACVAAVHVGPTLRQLQADNPEWAEHEIPIAAELLPSDSVIWTRKGEVDALAAIDRVIRQWHRSGWLIELGRRHGIKPSAKLLELHGQFRKQPA